MVSRNTLQFHFGKVSQNCRHKGMGEGGSLGQGQYCAHFQLHIYFSGSTKICLRVFMYKKHNFLKCSFCYHPLSEKKCYFNTPILKIAVCSDWSTTTGLSVCCYFCSRGISINKLRKVTSKVKHDRQTIM